MKALGAFRSKLLAPCRRLFRTFRFKLRKPLFIKPLRIFRPRRAKQRRKMDRVMELRSVSESGEQDSKKLLLLFPSSSSPVTPAYIKAFRAARRDGSRFGDEAVEDACRSFENYLVEMIVEEGKMNDLTDVEELLFCWKNLKSPVFIDLVCRFYGELCKDLFAPDYEK
ncbi:Transcription repressor OFP17 [Linum grandiflorum]